MDGHFDMQNGLYTHSFHQKCLSKRSTVPLTKTVTLIVRVNEALHVSEAQVTSLTSWTAALDFTHFFPHVCSTDQDIFRKLEFHHVDLCE